VADFEDARRIALTFPEATAEGTHIGVRRGSKIKGMAWLWNERVHPNKPRVPNPEVLQATKKRKHSWRRIQRSFSPNRTTTGSPRCWSA